MESLVIELSPKISQSFLAELESAGIAYQPILTFSQRDSSTLIHLVDSVVNALPWKDFFKMATAYFERHKHTHAVFHYPDGTRAEFTGFSDKTILELAVKTKPDVIALCHTDEYPKENPFKNRPTEPLE